MFTAGKDYVDGAQHVDLLEIAQPAPDAGPGRHVKHEVAASNRPVHRILVRNVALELLHPERSRSPHAGRATGCEPGRRAPGGGLQSPSPGTHRHR